MKTARAFPGILLVGLGLYEFLQQSGIDLFSGFFSWPTLLCLMGIAFLLPAYAGGDAEAILPGVILFGTGLHFHLVSKLNVWPDNIGIFLLFAALGLLLRARKTHSSILPGVLLMIISIFTLYYDSLLSWLKLSTTGIADPGKYWPFLLLILGGYLLISKKD